MDIGEKDILLSLNSGQRPPGTPIFHYETESLFDLIWHKRYGLRLDLKGQDAQILFLIFSPVSPVFSFQPG